MSLEHHPDRQYIHLTRLSRLLGLPAAWLKSEAEAGRLPHLRIGERLRFNVRDVERTLAERASAGQSVVEAGEVA